MASYAASKLDDIKAQQKIEAGKTDLDLGKLQALKAEQQKWEEGGAYRIALHTAVGGLSGGVQGAVGAGTAASAAPILNDLQDSLAKSLENAGANPDVAKAAAQLITGVTAAGIGSAASGGSPAGAATAFNVDANNRQLHPTEEQWIKDKAKDFAKREGISEKQALERLTQQALKNVDYLWRAQLSDGDDADAKAFLAANKQTFINDLGEQQRLFTAQGQQLFRPEMFADSTDPAFYKQLAQSGISRSLGEGLAKELMDSVIALTDGTIDLLKAARDNPDIVANALWNAVKGLPQAVKDNFTETGHAIGEGGAIALNADINAKLNAIYGSDVSRYQEAMLTIRTLSAISGAAGAAKVGTGLSVATAKAVSKKLDDELARQFKLDAGAIKGFKSADELNAAMLEANKSLLPNQAWSPAWMPGTAVAETTLAPGTRVRMVVDEAAFRALTDPTGKTDVSRAFGGWATFDNVPNQAYARNQLAITSEMKGNVSYVIEVEVTKPINAHVGIVGPQNTAAGGGNQLHFILQPADRSNVFKYVSGSVKVLP